MFFTLEDFRESYSAAAFAFRGYNFANLGRTPELLEHPLYGPVVEQHLRHAERVAADAGHAVELVDRIRARRESTLDSFDEDIALLLSVEAAQLDLLRRFFHIDYAHARLGFGYSLGEVAALVAGGVYRLEDVLPQLLNLADDCAALARHTTMGVVFSRGPVLNQHLVHKLCLEINLQQRGLIAVSSYLSPNTLLLLGEYDTVDRFKQRMRDLLGPETHLRKNEHRWPPLHTPLVWQRAVPNRAAVAMFAMGGGIAPPRPPVLSLVTGKMSYNDHNSRETLTRWLDHPQLLWDVVYEVLSLGVQTIIHVGPDPNLIPATFKRLSDNVTAQLTGTGIDKFGMRAVQGMAHRPWLSRVLPRRVALLRAPSVRHVIVEDWLLEPSIAEQAQARS